MAGVQPFANLPAILQKQKTAIASAVTDIVRAGVAEGGRHLVEETPVKRGVARSNWVATIGSPFVSTIPAYHPIPHLGGGPAPVTRKGETENANAAMAQHKSALAAFDANKDSVVFLRNNIPYIELLNDGWSRQSGSGWFEQAVEAIVKAVQGRWRFNL